MLHALTRAATSSGPAVSDENTTPLLDALVHCERLVHSIGWGSSTKRVQMLVYLRVSPIRDLLQGCRWQVGKHPSIPTLTKVVCTETT